jgi:tetratricopeptide (TPR) repeat protein
MIPLLLLVAAQTGPVDTAASRFDRCVALARTDPVAALAEATRWSTTGGAAAAQRCAGLAYAAQDRFEDAANAFGTAARAAQQAHDDRAGADYEQAGNAWLAAQQPAKARAALDSALLQGTLTGLDLGEARLDHARALVALGDMSGARSDIDRALESAAEEPVAWLLSATLARRMGDAKRAEKDITEALKRAPADPAIQLEAGNIAAVAGDEATAKAAWQEAARLAPGTPIGRSATAALAQFGPVVPTASTEPTRTGGR